MKTIPTTTIQFPEIQLQARDAHKLRGYFGNLFKEHSILLHNHFDGAALRYAYPLVQYKVIGKVPTLFGFGEGADLLVALFLKIRELYIEERRYEVLNKHIQRENREIGVSEDLHTYEFQTLWMALNQKNYPRYRKSTPEEQQTMLKQIAIGNILSFYKSCQLYLTPEERVLVQLDLQQKSTQFKDQTMWAFTGAIVSNALLPDGIGIGKSTSRGFGTLFKKSNDPLGDSHVSTNFLTKR